MKKHRLLFLAAAAGLFLTGIASSFFEPTKATADVEQVQGVYVYIKSKPVLEYEFIGAVKPPAIMEEDIETVTRKLVERAKKEFPDVEAIVFTDNTHADAIKFK